MQIREEGGSHRRSPWSAEQAAGAQLRHGQGRAQSPGTSQVRGYAQTPWSAQCIFRTVKHGCRVVLSFDLLSIEPLQKVISLR